MKHSTIPLRYVVIAVALYCCPANLMAMQTGGESMVSNIEQRLTELGITLPAAASPVANYVPFVVSGKQVYISGQLPMHDGVAQYTGYKMQDNDSSVEIGKKAARLCALNILAQLKAAAGSLDTVKRCVRLGGFVNAEPFFTKHPEVMNGASDLMVQVFGEKGKHARAAVGVSSLPRSVCVEIDALFELE
jgi:enamine deaminase RidA (YjgF/YER057c/UK114 family)